MKKIPLEILQSTKITGRVGCTLETKKVEASDGNSWHIDVFFSFAEKLETRLARHANLVLLIGARVAIMENVSVVKASSCFAQCRLLGFSSSKQSRVESIILFQSCNIQNDEKERSSVMKDNS